MGELDRIDLRLNLAPRTPRQARAPFIGAVTSGGVVDPNNTSYSFGGLAVSPVYVGSAVSCTFTVSHHRGLFLGVFPGSATFSGVVSTGGLVVATMPAYKVSLQYGDYEEVRLTTSSVLSSSSGSVTVTVGPENLMASARIGLPFSPPTASLTATVAVQPGSAPTPIAPVTSGTGSKSSSSSSTSTSTQNTNPSTIPGWLWATGAGVVVVGGGVLLFRHGPGVAARAHERRTARDQARVDASRDQERTRREELRLEQERERSEQQRAHTAAVRAAARATRQAPRQVFDVEAE